MDTTTTRGPGRRTTLSAYAPVIILLLLAGFAVEEGLRLLLTVDPAAQADMAGWYVLALGVILAVTTACAERPSTTHPASTSDSGGGTNDDQPGHVPAHPRRDMTVFLLLVACYAVLVEPLGYALTGVLVVFGYLFAIARYGWLRSVLGTLVLNAAFVALFELAGVVLPAGILGF